MNLVPLQQAPAPQNQAITYPRYEPPKIVFFEQKAIVPLETDNNLILEVGQMKKMMSQMNNELTHLRLSQGKNNNFQRNNVGPYNNNAGNNGGGNNFNPPNHNNGFQRQN